MIKRALETSLVLYILILLALYALIDYSQKKMDHDQIAFYSYVHYKPSIVKSFKEHYTGVPMYDTEDPIDFENLELDYENKYELDLNEQYAFDSIKKISGLGIGTISDPEIPKDKNDEWRGCYVYFGKYNGQKIKYKVLDNDSKKFGTKSLFLDCDLVLFTDVFDDDRRINEGAESQNSWENSDIQKTLNDLFIYEAFSRQERDAIINSYTDSYELNGPESDAYIDELTAFRFKNYTPLKGDKLFLLDAEDIYNPNYGYFNCAGINKNHMKDGFGIYSWYIRSKYYSDNLSAPQINRYGNLMLYEVDYGWINGVSPALNIDYNKVLFSSNNTPYKNVYYLTLLSEDIQTFVNGTIEKNGNYYSVPLDFYAQNDGYINTVSLLILDKEFREGNENGANVLEYYKLGVPYFKDKTFEFELPDDLPDDYYVYVIAENVNYANATDYASYPLKLSLPERNLYVIKKGDTLSGIAKKLGVTKEEILKQNDIKNPNILTIGKVIYF